MRRIGIAGAALVLILAGAGCGGSNDAASDAAGEDTVTQESTSTDTSATTEDSSGETTDTDGLGGLSGECGDLVEASQAFGAAVASSLGTGDNELGDTADLYKDFAENAPDELKDDFETLADLMADYATALADLDLQAGETPSAEQIAKLATIGQSLSTSEAQEANAAISAWTQENCGSNP